MATRLLNRCAIWFTSWIRSLPAFWREPHTALRRARRGLDFPLLPSTFARRAVWMWLGAQAVLAVELGLTAHPWSALAIGMLDACFFWMWRRAQRQEEQPRRLLISADGRVHLLNVTGAVMPVQLQPSSVSLGPWLLLLARSHERTHRLLLGPDNLEPALLAALRRRVLALKTTGEEAGILKYPR